MRNFTGIDQEILDLCLKGEKLAAVKLYKERASKGLSESKEYVENLLEEFSAGSNSSPEPTTLDEQLIKLCRQGNNLAAIKLYADKTHRNLQESVDYVTRLQQKNGMEPTSFARKETSSSLWQRMKDWFK